MNKVFFDVAVSLDGFIAGLNGGAANPLGDRGLELHQWMFPLSAFRAHLNMEGGLENEDNELVKHLFDRAGAYVMGKNMFIEGEANWPEKAPFRAPVFVVTHEKRDPWVRPGGTTFHFIQEGIESALDQARSAAGNKDVRISGGADIIRQCLNAGLVDEFTLHLVPLMLGTGVRLFENINAKQTYHIMEVITSPHVTHVSYEVRR